VAEPKNANKIFILAKSSQAQIASHHRHNTACFQQQQQQSNKVSYFNGCMCNFCQCPAPLATTINSRRHDRQIDKQQRIISTAMTSWLLFLLFFGSTTTPASVVVADAAAVVVVIIAVVAVIVPQLRCLMLRSFLQLWSFL